MHYLVPMSLGWVLWRNTVMVRHAFCTPAFASKSIGRGSKSLEPPYNLPGCSSRSGCRTKKKTAPLRRARVHSLSLRDHLSERPPLLPPRRSKVSAPRGALRRRLNIFLLLFRMTPKASECSLQPHVIGGPSSCGQPQSKILPHEKPIWT